nr:hypothetical protein BaRGS_002452 [Batillaria attramentaria]
MKLSKCPISNDDYNRLQLHPSNQQLLRSPSLPEDDYSHIVTQSQNLQHSAPGVAELHDDAPETEKGRDDAAKTSTSILSQGDSSNAGRQHADHGSDGVDVHSGAENAKTQVDDGYTLPSTGGAVLVQSNPPKNGYSEVGTHPSGLQPLNALNADLYSDVEITKVDEGYTLPSTGEAMLVDPNPPENGYSEAGTFPADIQPPSLLDADLYSDVQEEGKQQEVNQKPAAEKSVKFSLPPADGYSQNEDQLPEPPTPEGEGRGELYSKVHKTNGEKALQAPEEPRDSALYSQVHKKGKGDVTTQPPGEATAQSAGEATAQSPGDATEDQLYSTVDKKKTKPVIPKKPTIAKKPVQ